MLYTFLAPFDILQIGLVVLFRQSWEGQKSRHLFGLLLVADPIYFQNRTPRIRNVLVSTLIENDSWRQMPISIFFYVFDVIYVNGNLDRTKQKSTQETDWHGYRLGASSRQRTLVAVFLDESSQYLKMFSSFAAFFCDGNTATQADNGINWNSPSFEE